MLIFLFGIVLTYLLNHVLKINKEDEPLNCIRV